MSDRFGPLLGTTSPIVLGPFGGLSSIELTATVSRLGGLGSCGLYGYSPDRIRETVDLLRNATAAPFALNLWLPTGDERDPDQAVFDRQAESLAPLFAEVGLEPPKRPESYLPAIEDQIEAALEADAAAISFVYGVPPAEVVAEARRRGTAILGTATTVDEAVALEAGGVDAIVASGFEAAGHRVSFLEPAERSLVG
ncbi:MAG: nitronate monooxygenase, partial [Actinomycetota bacterium]|nr:nitronate monooxygenase [Actinomycetota bacterium]